MRHTTCDFPGELLSAYLDNEVTESESARVRGHLQDCAHCRRRLEQLRETREILSEVPSQSVPSSFRRQLRADLLRHKEDKPGLRGSGSGWLRRMPMVAAVLLLLLLPVAGLYSHVSAPGEPLMMSMRAVGEDDAPADAPQLESADPEPETDAQMLSEVLRVDEAERSESIILHVADVQEGTAALAALADTVDAEVQSHEQVWDADGYLKESESLLQVDSDSYAILREGVLRMGTLARQRVEADPVVHRDEMSREFAAAEEADQRTHLRVVMMVDDETISDVQLDELCLVRTQLEETTFPAQLREAAARSWTVFGAHVAYAVLWIAARIPHLIFVSLLVVTVIFALSAHRRKDSA